DVVRGVRLGKAPQAEEGLGLPELRFERRRRRGRRLRAPERLQRGLGVAQREPRASEQEQGVADTVILWIVGDEPLEHAACDRVEAVGERALADQPEPLGLVQSPCGRGEERDHEGRAMEAAALEPGALDAVAGARRAGFQTALWTNNARAVTLPALERLGLAALLDLVVTRDDMSALKPDPDGWRVISERFAD